MRRRFLAPYGAALCFVAWLGTAAWANLGAVPLSPERFNELPQWKPDAEGTGEFYRIDLRAYLPPVANQGAQNSCTGFAVGYACKTYLEVRDQNWQPNDRSRVFSPAYLYNQINGGRDRGASIVQAIELLRTQGCATLATMPYDERNYTTRPKQEAVAEAARFKCRGFLTVRSGPLIRAALRQGHAVVIGVRTDPVFRSGRYTVFTKEEKARGDRARTNDETHGFHAMLVVGYDDAREAFLLMNSWGSTWGQSGYCWVAYDLMDKVEHSGDNFLREAYIVLDIQGDARPHAPPPADRAASVWGRLYYVGYIDGNHRWSWRGALTCSEATAAIVDRVVWSIPGPQGPITAVRTSPLDGFGLDGYRIGPGAMTLTGVVHFKDRTSKQVSANFLFQSPTAKERNVQLIQTDRYWGVRGNQDFWEWSLRLTGSLTDLADVRQVTYHLHPSFPNPNRVAQGTPENGFEFTTRGWGVFQVRATVLFKDGSKLPLQVMLKFQSPVKRQLVLNNFARRSQVSHGNEIRYDWTAYIDGPLNTLRSIRAVEYLLHPTFNPNRVWVGQGMDYGFPLSRNGWGVFQLTARVHFQDGTTQNLTHRIKLAGAPESPTERSGIR